MITRVFTNRRRAKDALINYQEHYGDNDVTVLVTQDGMVYIQTPDQIGNPFIFHFGTLSLHDISGISHIVEEYRGESARKFRV